MVYAWGANDYGQLGIGNLVSRPFPTEVKVGTSAPSDVLSALQLATAYPHITSHKPTRTLPHTLTPSNSHTHKHTHPRSTSDTNAAHGCNRRCVIGAWQRLQRATATALQCRIKGGLGRGASATNGRQVQTHNTPTNQRRMYFSKEQLCVCSTTGVSCKPVIIIPTVLQDMVDKKVKVALDSPVLAFRFHTHLRKFLCHTLLSLLT